MVTHSSPAERDTSTSSMRVLILLLSFSYWSSVRPHGLIYWYRRDQPIGAQCVDKGLKWSNEVPVWLTVRVKSTERSL